MTTPQQLERLSLKRGLSYEKLAREIAAAAGYPVSASGIWRFCHGRKSTRLTRNAIEIYMESRRRLAARAKASAARKAGVAKAGVALEARG